jgi:uncharacterized repeat protein (TIGR01451 family)
MRIQITKWLSRLLVCVLLTAATSFPAMAAIAYVGKIGTASVTSSTGGPNSVSITVTSAVAAGHLIALQVALSGLQSGGAGPFYPVIPSDSQSNTYIGRGGGTSGFDSTLQAVSFVAIATTALQPGDTITASFNTAFIASPAIPTYTALAAALEFSGVSAIGDGNIKGASGQDGSPPTFDTGAVVTTNADDLMFSFLAVQSTAVTSLTQTNTPSFATPIPLIQVGGITLLPMYSIKSATGSYGLQGGFNGTTSPFPPFIVSVYALQASTAATNANLTVHKSHVGNFTQGQNGANYTLAVDNTGTAATSGTITVTDTLPTGLSFVSGSGSGWSCSAVAQAVSCTSSTSIDAGGNSDITLTVNVAANATSVINQASVACNAPCAVSGNPASDPTTIIAPLPPPPPPPPPVSIVPAPALNTFDLTVLVFLFGAAALFALRRIVNSM